MEVEEEEVEVMPKEEWASNGTDSNKKGKEK